MRDDDLARLKNYVRIKATIFTKQQTYYELVCMRYSVILSLMQACPYLCAYRCMELLYTFMCRKHNPSTVVPYTGPVV